MQGLEFMLAYRCGGTGIGTIDIRPVWEDEFEATHVWKRCILGAGAVWQT